MNELIDKIQNMIDAESKRVGELYGPIRSAEEGYGVLAEEMMEMTVAADQTKGTPQTGMTLYRLLEAMHRNDSEAMIAVLAEIQEGAWHAAAEAVQVAAVCERYYDFLKGGAGCADDHDGRECTEAAAE